MGIKTFLYQKFSNVRVYPMQTIDGNGAVASVAFRTSEVIAIYPITPSSTMAEQADAWAGNGLKNVWGDVPAWSKCSRKPGHWRRTRRAADRRAFHVVYLIAGFAADDPDAVQTGRSTDAVCSARRRAYRCHPRSLIFGDHSDVMAVRQTGCAMLCASSVQEAQDFALISHIATLKSRVPFIHFFDGFRTSTKSTKSSRWRTTLF
jgi:pyruvate-ferredoxin/flavodoxin oxidoreductase